MKLSKICQKCGKEFFKKHNVSVEVWPTRKYCSVQCSNLDREYKPAPWLDEYKFKPGSQLGKGTQFKKGENTGAANSKWKGDNASYAAIHIWVKNHFGKPALCEKCGVTDRKMYHWANISKSYKRERSDWMRLCVPCHKQMDMNRLDKRKTYTTNSSGYRGVTYARHTNRWRASLSVNRKPHHLGYFDTPEEASFAYNMALKKMKKGTQ